MSSIYASNKVVSLDCECNGLHGQIFAAAASVQTRDDGERFTSQYRIPIDDPVDPWVAEHVLPVLDGPSAMLMTPGGDFRGMAGWWRSLYDPLKVEGYDVLVHVGWPVEARFLWYAHMTNPFSGPFPLKDVSMTLEQSGHDPTDLTGFLGRARMLDAVPGIEHQPLRDARAAALAYWILTR